MVAAEVRRARQIPWDEVTSRCELLGVCGCWKSKLGLLEEQYIKPSLIHILIIVLFTVDLNWVSVILDVIFIHTRIS